MSGRTPVYFGEAISQGEIAEAMRAAGLHMRSEGHRLVVDRVPAWLRHDEAEIVPLKRRKRA